MLEYTSVKGFPVTFEHKDSKENYYNFFLKSLSIDQPKYNQEFFFEMDTALESTEAIQAKSEDLLEQIDTNDSNQIDPAHRENEHELEETHSNNTYISEEANLDQLYGELQENKDTKLGVTKCIVENAYALIAETSSVEEKIMDDPKYSAEIDDLQNQIKTLILELKNSRGNVEKQNKEIIEISQRNIQITKELEEATIKSNNLEKDLSEAKATMALKTNAITTDDGSQSNQNSSKEEGYNETAFKDMKENYITEKKLKEDSLQQLSNFKEKFSIAEQEKQSVEKAFSQVFQEKNDIQQKLSAAELENQNLRKELTCSEEVKEEMEKKIAENDKIQSEIRQKCSTLEEQKDYLTQKFTSMEIQYNDVLRNKKKNEEEHEKNIDLLQQSINSLEKEKEDTLQQISLSQSEKEAAIENTELADKARSEALDQLASLEKVKDETIQQLTDAKQDIQDLLQKIKLVEDAKEKYASQVTQLQGEKEDLQQTLSALTSDKEVLNKKISEIENLNTAMTETASEEKIIKEETLDKLHIAEESNNELKQVITTLESKNDVLQDKLNQFDEANNNEIEFMDEDEMNKYLRLSNITRRILEKSGVDPIAYKIGFQKKISTSDTIDDPKPSPVSQTPNRHHGHFNFNDLVEYFDDRVVDMFGKQQIASYLAEELINYHELIDQREEINNESASENNMSDDECENLKTKIETKKVRVLKLSKMLGISGDKHIHDQNFIHDKSPEKSSLWESKKKSFLNDSRFKSLNLGMSITSYVEN